MLYAFKLGPIETGEGAVNSYVGFAEDGLMRPPVLARDDREGLRQLAAGAGRGQALRCEPELAPAGRPLGFEPAPLPEDLIFARAALALGFALGRLAEHVRDPGVFLELARAASEFARAEPWALWLDEIPLEVTVTGAIRARYEGAILGGEGEVFGLALYDEPGALARIAALLEGERSEDAACFDGLSVTLDQDPAWAVGALAAAFGIEDVPIAARIRQGRPVAPSEAEVAMLAAALDAAARLTPGGGRAAARVEVGGHRVTVEIRALACDPLAEAPAAAPPRAHVAVGRNDPCPCGSGRKYKKCHLPADEAAGRTGAPALHARDRRLVGELAAYAARHLGDRWSEAVEAGYPARSEEEIAAEGQLLDPWSVYECGVEGRAVVERYLEERGGKLAPADRAWLEAQRRAWLSIWEVREVEPGERVTLRDLLTGEKATVTETSGSRTLVARDALLARVVTHEGTAVLCGAHPRPLPPLEADAVVATVRRKLGSGASAVPVAQLKAEGASVALIAAWRKRVAALDRRPPPQLANTDGDPLLLTTDRFTIARGGREEVERRLAAMPGAGDLTRDGAASRFSVLRAGNAMHRSWENTVVGSVVIEAEEVRVETNSVRRADDLRRAVEEACGGLVTHAARDHVDPSALLRHGASPPPACGPMGAAPPPDAPGAPPDADSPAPAADELAEALRAFKARTYADWLDESIPALGGLTPREATRTSRYRRKLAVLLKDMENRESRLPPAERFDFGPLRAQLGLPAD